MGLGVLFRHKIIIQEHAAVVINGSDRASFLSCIERPFVERGIMLDQVSVRSSQYFLALGFSLLLGFIAFQRFCSFDHGNGRYLDPCFLSLSTKAV